MKKQVLQLSVLALFFAVGCGADKSSSDACQYETTMNLDNGSYDAVLASGCADSMQKGAAYFGKAGYDVTNVINSFSSIGSSTSTSSTSDVNTYLTQLIGEVSGETLNNLSMAKTEYESILPASEQYQDAQFYVSIVDAVNGVSLIKAVVDSTGLGSIDMDCDMNGNSIPDELDAASCALTNGVGCATGVVRVLSGTPTTPLGFTGKSGSYQGATLTVSGSGDSSACPSPNSYQKLLSTNFVVVTENVTEGLCTDISVNASGNWPCPLELNGSPIDLVTALDQSITSAIDAMGSALPAGTAADVQQAISDIKAEACPSGTCTGTDLANYLETF